MEWLIFTHFFIHSVFVYDVPSNVLVVAYNVIFCFIGVPHVLQFDNGREYANKRVKENISNVAS